MTSPIVWHVAYDKLKGPNPEPVYIYRESFVSKLAAQTFAIRLEQRGYRTKIWWD